MLKIRMQGTKREIVWFSMLLKRCKSLDVLNHSKIFSNKGTDKYFRMYAEIQEKEIKEGNENE
jgi:hypothetical protein